jgi:uncharacterized protein with HEPN domain
MPRDSRLYLSDIRKAIGRIETSIQGLDKVSFSTDNEKVDSVLFNLMTIGEAAKNVPQAIREMKPDVSWSAIGRFRDFVVHHYFDIDMDKVWDILTSDIPELKQQIEALLQDLSTGGDNNGEEQS